MAFHMTHEEVREMLDSHKNWIETGEGEQADFSDRAISNFVFSGIDLDEVMFDNAELTNCTFDMCSMIKTSFWSASMKDLEFIDCDMGLELGQADMRNVHFIDNSSKKTTYNDVQCQYDTLSCG